MVILKRGDKETTCTFTFPRSKKENYIELIFHYEDEEKYKTANVRVSTDYAREFIKELHETIFLKELNDIL